MRFYKAIMKRIRNTHLFAFVQGFYERFRFGDGFGRSHDTDDDWNEAYDMGANLSDRITGTKVDGSDDVTVFDPYSQLGPQPDVLPAKKPENT